MILAHGTTIWFCPTSLPLNCHIQGYGIVVVSRYGSRDTVATNTEHYCLWRIGGMTISRTPMHGVPGPYVLRHQNIGLCVCVGRRYAVGLPYSNVEICKAYSLAQGRRVRCSTVVGRFTQRWRFATESIQRAARYLPCSASVWLRIPFRAMQLHKRIRDSVCQSKLSMLETMFGRSNWNHRGRISTSESSRSI